MNALLIRELEPVVQEKVTCGDTQQRITELSQAVDIGMEQLRRNQVVDGQISRENMKRKIDTLVNGKNDN